VKKKKNKCKDLEHYNINKIIENTKNAITEKQKNIINRIQQIYVNNPRKNMNTTITSLLNRSKELLEGK